MDERPDNHDGDKPVNRGGRPSKWDDSMIEQAYLYCLEHHGTNQDLANHLGIGCRTLYLYMEQFPQFSHAIKDGRKTWRQSGCGSTVRSLYKQAELQIRRVPKVKVKKAPNEKGEMVTVERTVTMEQHVQWPNQRAIEFILVNQDPENWGRTVAIEDPVAYAEQVIQALRDMDDTMRQSPPPDEPDGSKSDTAIEQDG